MLAFLGAPLPLESLRGSCGLLLSWFRCILRLPRLLSVPRRGFVCTRLGGAGGGWLMDLFHPDHLFVLLSKQNPSRLAEAPPQVL